MIERLQDHSLYDHKVTGFEVLETHISWVLLTGLYAYKIKKPVSLGFADLSTLAKRRHACFEELRLNRRLAPTLYLDVVAIDGSIEQPVLNGLGSDPGAASEATVASSVTIEYAVKMRQFDQAALLDRLAADGELIAEHIDSLAAQVAAFHQQLAPAPPDSEYGNADQVNAWVEQNFDQIRPLLREAAQLKQLDNLQKWTEAARQRYDKTFRIRKTRGFIRECHGDMHLGNIALIEGQVTIFDGIDFNAELRWIDVMSEVAFVVMDLHDRAYSRFACRFLDRYLQQTGDYTGLTILPYYLVYRALVRAKVDLLRLQQGSLSNRQATAKLDQYQGYMDLALAFSRQQKPALFITHGLSASGKSMLADELVEAQGLIRIRTDVERKRLFSMEAEDRSGSALDAGIYSSAATLQTYQRVSELAEQLLYGGYSVLVDATFLKEWQRDTLQVISKRLQVRFLIIDCQAPEDVLRERLRRRQAQAKDPSEADLEVLQSQLQTREPLTENEQKYTIAIDTAELSAAAAAEVIQRYCND